MKRQSGAARLHQNRIPDNIEAGAPDPLADINADGSPLLGYPALSDTEIELGRMGLLGRDTTAGTAAGTSVTPKKRSTYLTQQRLDRTLRAAVAVGLTPSKIALGADGSVTIYFGETEAKDKPHVPKGWIIPDALPSKSPRFGASGAVNDPPSRNRRKP